MKLPLSIAHLAGLSAFQLALALAFIDARLAALPLAVYVAMALVAPFLTRFGYFLPILSHGGRDLPRVALSFDDGPDPQVTPAVLDILDRHGIRAVFFLVGEKAEAHPELVREILARGHDVGNHSWHHHPFVMLKGARFLAREVGRAQEIFATFGVQPRAFRPPVGITSPALWPVLLDHGMFCLNFSCRAADMGNRRVAGAAGRILAKVRAGDLILLHDVRPPKGVPEAFLGELETLLAGLAEARLEVVPPAVLLGRALMAPSPGNRGPAEAFYDGLAATYDHEQFETGVARSRTLEQRLFRARAAGLLQGAGKVLEVGAGTGIFTLEIAAFCREVQAVDLSRNMLDHLERKAAAAGITNIRTVAADAEAVAFDGPYSAVCCFLAFEYFQDLPGFFRRLAPHMEPGGRVYFITARTSFFRFWTQVGNALRQGIWLRSRTRRQVTAFLHEAGVTDLRVEGHLLKSFLSGGMILEVEGRWPGLSPRADA